MAPQKNLRTPLPDDPAGEAEKLGIGSVVDGKYRLVRELDSGGMGTVYVAKHEALDVEVALKVIRAGPTSVQDPELVARLLQEARAAAQLGDPAIVRVFDLGLSSEGNPYIVMELLQGEDLASVMDRRGPLDAVRAVQTILPVAHALATAHDHGIVHRDVKPENIFLAHTEDGGIQPKLIDFGVAKLERQTNTRLTRLGSLLGSPDYMSPEQARGLEVDHTTDVWSLCVVLYEMLVGETPFSASNHNALMRSIIDERHASILTQGVGDEALSAILDRGLAKSPAERWPSVRALGKALACWLLDRSVTEDLCASSLSRTWLEEHASGASRDGFDPASIELPSPPPHTPVRQSGARITPWLFPTRATVTLARGGRSRSHALTLLLVAAPVALLVAGLLWLAPSRNATASPDHGSAAAGARSASASDLGNRALSPSVRPYDTTARPAVPSAAQPSSAPSATTSGTAGLRPHMPPPSTTDQPAPKTSSTPPPGTTDQPTLKTPKF